MDTGKHLFLNFYFLCGFFLLFLFPELEKKKIEFTVISATLIKTVHCSDATQWF